MDWQARLRMHQLISASLFVVKRAVIMEVVNWAPRRTWRGVWFWENYVRITRFGRCYCGRGPIKQVAARGKEELKSDRGGVASDRGWIRAWGSECHMGADWESKTESKGWGEIKADDKKREGKDGMTGTWYNTGKVADNMKVVAGLGANTKNGGLYVWRLEHRRGPKSSKTINSRLRTIRLKPTRCNT